MRATVKSTNFAAVPACAVLILCTAGCANSPPSDFFILTPVAGGAASAAAAPGIEPLSLGVGPVKIPEYLNRAQIVTRPGPNRLDVNEFNRWGGSLAPNISSVIAQNLAVLLGTDEVFVFPGDDPANPRYRVILSIRRFDGTLGENVVLDARWFITGPRRREQLGTGRSVIREATNGSGYEDYVAAQSRALETLSRKIAAEVIVLRDAAS